MRRFALGILAVLASTLPATHSAGAGTPDTLCAPGTMGWVSLIESGGAIPSFMFGAELVMDHVVICDDGVFFFFRARTQGSVKSFSIGFVKPTQEAVTEYMGTDPADPTGKSISILEATAIASQNYTDFRQQMVEALGSRYAFGRPVSLKKDRWKAKLRIEFGKPFVFSYRKREAAIQTGVFNIYTEPEKEVMHPVLLFLLLMPH